jgi:hypothetical protein
MQLIENNYFAYKVRLNFYVFESCSFLLENLNLFKKGQHV